VTRARALHTGGDVLLRPAVSDDEASTLDLEARVFGRYLIGRVPPAELVERYRAANRVLFPSPAPAAEAAVVRFARRHPWSVSLLDGAVGLRRPGSLLRNKILVMAAILEASPTFAEVFLPPAAGPVSLVLRVAWLGALAIARAALGMLVYPVASRSRA
jgi:hypothetical protein